MSFAYHSGMTDIADPTPLQVTIHPLPQAAQQGTFWSQDTPTFKDLLDTINPLQHIPGIASLYQSLTGDIPSSGANLSGGALFGGPLGFASALANEITQSATGKDISDNLIAWVKGDASTQTAQNTTASTPYLSANQRAAYNSYVQTQNMLA